MHEVHVHDELITSQTSIEQASQAFFLE